DGGRRDRPPRRPPAPARGRRLYPPPPQPPLSPTPIPRDDPTATETAPPANDRQPVDRPHGRGAKHAARGVVTRDVLRPWPVAGRYRPRRAWRTSPPVTRAEAQSPLQGQRGYRQRATCDTPPP